MLISKPGPSRIDKIEQALIYLAGALDSEIEESANPINSPYYEKQVKRILET